MKTFKIINLILIDTFYNLFIPESNCSQGTSFHHGLQLLVGMMVSALIFCNYMNEADHPMKVILVIHDIQEFCIKSIFLEKLDEPCRVLTEILDWNMTGIALIH